MGSAQETQGTGGKERIMVPRTGDTGHRRQRTKHGTPNFRHRAQEAKKEAWDPIQETQGMEHGTAHRGHRRQRMRHGTPQTRPKITMIISRKLIVAGKNI